MNERLLGRMNLSGEEMERLVDRELAEVDRRMKRFSGRTVIVVDDGIATGGTVLAAAQVLRVQGPASVVLAVPVCPPEAVPDLQHEFDEVAALATPRPFLAVGEHYDDFRQVSDDEVEQILAEARNA
jgi:putative phosphoribosyl transferase